MPKTVWKEVVDEYSRFFNFQCEFRKVKTVTEVHYEATLQKLENVQKKKWYNLRATKNWTRKTLLTKMQLCNI